MLTLSAIRADGEYRQLKDDLSRAFVGKTLPFAASGLCEGAANAAVLALLQDLRGKYRGAFRRRIRAGGDGGGRGAVCRARRHY